MIKVPFVFLMIALLVACSNENIEKLKAKVGLSKQITYTCQGQEIDSINKFGTNEVISKNVYKNIQLVIEIDMNKKYVNIGGNKNLATLFHFKEDHISNLENDSSYSFMNLEGAYSTLRIYKKTNEVFYMIAAADSTKTNTQYFEYEGKCQRI